MKRITLPGLLILVFTLLFLPAFVQSSLLDTELTKLNKASAEQKTTICSRDTKHLKLQNNDREYKIGLQVGHMNAKKLPEELSSLRKNTGAHGGEKTEWEVNYAVAIHAAEILQNQGIVVDIIPATVPPDYKADAFISIHADQNPNSSLTGFKAISSGFETSGKSDSLSIALHREYLKVTCMKLDRALTNNMRYYYAFNWKKFKHSIHPTTPAAIVELGFMSNEEDLKILLEQPDLLALGIANGVIRYLNGL